MMECPILKKKKFTPPSHRDARHANGTRKAAGIPRPSATTRMAGAAIRRRSISCSRPERRFGMASRQGRCRGLALLCRGTAFAQPLYPGWRTHFSQLTLGSDLAAGRASPARRSRGNCWQTAHSLGDWTLVGCTVAPGFDFASFELAEPGWEPANAEIKPSVISACAT